MRRRRRSLIGAAAFGVVSVIAVACGTFGGDEAPAGSEAGAESSADDVRANDDGDPSKTDAGVTDAPFDGGPCSWFCDDFDHDPWPGAGWASKDEFQGGAIGLTDAAFVSPPRSLRSVLDDASIAIAHGLYPRTYTGTFSALHCKVSVQVDSVGVDVGTILRLKAGYAGADASGNWDINLALTTNATTFYEEGTEVTLPVMGIGEWLEIGIDLKLGQRTRLTINGAIQNSGSPSPASDASAAPFVNATMTLGADRNAGPNGTWQVDYDNIACTLDP